MVQVASRIASHRNSDADPIGIRVAGQDEVRTDGPCLCDGRLERPGIFRIGNVTGDVREVAVGSALRGQDLNPCKACRFEHPRDRAFSHAVQRCIHDREVAGMADRLGKDRLDVDRVEFGADTHDRAVGEGLWQRLFGDLAIGGRLDAVDDTPIVRRDYLAAGAPVALESIVRRRIMRRRDHDACVTLKMPDGA